MGPAELLERPDESRGQVDLTAAHPVAGAIVGRMMQAAAERYGGDVASQAMDNPAIRQIMERSSLESLLTQAGAADPQALKQLNDALQKIEKP